MKNRLLPLLILPLLLLLTLALSTTLYARPQGRLQRTERRRDRSRHQQIAL